MNIVRHSEAYYTLLDKIPQVVAQIKQWEGITNKQLFAETVCEYTRSGSLFSKSSFCVDEDDILDHIKQAKKRADCTIDVTDASVVITRSVKDGTKFVATYVPVTE